MHCTVHTPTTDAIISSNPDFPITTKRFEATIKDDSFVVQAKDLTAFKTGLNTVLIPCIIAYQMQKLENDSN